MKREEIKNIVRHVFHFYEVNAENCNWADMNEACGEIFKALEQEPVLDRALRKEKIQVLIELSEEAYKQLIEAGIPFQEIYDSENSEIKNEVKDLSKRVETLEKLIKEDKEEQLNRLKAELDYAKFCCTFSS